MEEGPDCGGGRREEGPGWAMRDQTVGGGGRRDQAVGGGTRLWGRRREEGPGWAMRDQAVGGGTRLWGGGEEGGGTRLWEEGPGWELAIGIGNC